MTLVSGSALPVATAPTIMQGLVMFSTVLDSLWSASAFKKPRWLARNPAAMAVRITSICPNTSQKFMVFLFSL